MILLHLLGHLGKDPIKRTTPQGHVLWELSLACSIRKEAVWWKVVFWGEAWERKLKHLKKGNPVFVIAEMTSPLDIYRGQDNSPKVSYQAEGKSIHFVSLGRQDEKKDESTTQYSQEIEHGKDNSRIEDMEELPF